MTRLTRRGADFNASGNISSSLNVDNAYNSTVAAYSINGTDQVPLDADHHLQSDGESGAASVHKRQLFQYFDDARA